MSTTVTFDDPTGVGPSITLEKFTVPKDVVDYEQRISKIPTPDPYYVGLGTLYKLAALERVRIEGAEGLTPMHVAVRGHMGTGKDHDIEQFAALLDLPYYRIPLTGEVRDVTLLGSTKLHGDGKGGTESRWEDGDITRALRGPAVLNLSELNAAGAETLFALHGLLDRYQAIDLPTGERLELRDDVRVFGTMNPTDLRDYAGTQTLNKAFADRWVIWEKAFPSAAQLSQMFSVRYPGLKQEFVDAISRLAEEINESFASTDAGTRVETPLSLRTTLDRIPVGLEMYSRAEDPLRIAWEEFVLPHVDAYDRDHYETVWAAIVRKGPKGPPFS